MEPLVTNARQRTFSLFGFERFLTSLIFQICQRRSRNLSRWCLWNDLQYRIHLRSRRKVLSTHYRRCQFSLSSKFFLGLIADTSPRQINNCGRLGNVCLIAGGVPGAVACVNGVCQATACALGFTKSAAGLCVAINTATDRSSSPFAVLQLLLTILSNPALNCGKIGNLCVFVPVGATGMCQNSICVLSTCPAGYTIKMGTAGVQNVCVKNLTPSARARMAKRETAKKTLCPAYVPCPLLD